MTKIDIFTDGACYGNPGAGGYAVIIREEGQQERLLKAGYQRTTNNRMELLAVIRGLEEVKEKKANICVYSDSKYVVEAVRQRWVWNWQKKGFKKKKNVDLWRRYLSLDTRTSPSLCWIEGHAGHKENERCDRMAQAETRRVRRGQGEILTDEEYEKEHD